VRLGNALVGQASYDEAIEQFQRALAFDPGNLTARNGLDRALTLQRTRRPPDTR
jgi:tetratricopeptide (TPR) repeat protein